MDLIRRWLELDVERATLTPFRLPLTRALRTANGTFTAREGILLCLEGGGHSGWGEASPLAAFGGESLDESARALERLARSVVGGGAGDLEPLLLRARSVAPPAALAAFDAARSDLAARLEGRRLAEWLAHHCGREGAVRDTVPVNAVLAGDDPAAVEAAARTAVAAGFETVKLKVATGDDEARVAAARRGAGPDARLRLDANGGWSEAEAEAALERLAPHDLELVEQPLAAGDLAGARRLRARSVAPIAADESVCSYEDARRTLCLGAADLLIVKPGVLGIEAAKRVAFAAAARGLEIVVTSALDSAVGVAAALHFAAVAPGLAPDRACGLATGALFADDFARLEPRAGRLWLPRGPGLGVVPDPAALDRCRTGPDLRISA